MELRRRRPENPCKRYVKVRADFGLDGSIRPLLFRGEDGPVFRIDRILDVRPGRVAQGGRTREPLCVRGGGKHRRAVHDEPYWFVEREEADRVAPHIVPLCAEGRLLCKAWISRARARFPQKAGCFRP